MDPIAFALGPLEIRWYGIAMALSMLCGAWIASRLLKRMGYNGEVMWDGLFWIILAGVIGARLGYVLTSPSHVFYAGAPWYEVIAVWHGGLSIHGGVILGAFATWKFFKRHGIPFLCAADAMAPGIGLGIILVRIGNFMNGDILGYEWSGPWAMNFPFDLLHQQAGVVGQTAPAMLRHPTELYGILVGCVVLITAILLWNSSYITRKVPVGAATFGLVLAYSLARGVLEDPFRNVPLYPAFIDPEVHSYGIMTMSQWVALVLIVLSIWAFTQLRKWERLRATAVASAKQAPAKPAKSRQERRAEERQEKKYE